MTNSPPENSVAIVPKGETSLPFQLYQTRPSSITYHWIWDHELEKLVNISRPVTLGLATLFAGGFLGLLPSLFEAFDKVGEGTVLSLWGLALCMTAALCLAAAIACGFFAYRGQRDAEGICSGVRTRNLTAVTPPQRGGDGKEAGIAPPA